MHLIIIFTALLPFLLLKTANADIVAPNPHCYLKGKVLSKGIRERSRLNNPDEQKEVRYKAKFVELEIVSIRTATKDEVKYGWQSGPNSICKLGGQPGHLYTKVKKFDFSGSDQQFSKMKTNSLVSGVAHEAGDEYGLVHYWEPKNQ